MTANDMSIKTVALNRIIGKVHLDSVTDVKQTSDFARLLFLYFVINLVADMVIIRRRDAKRWKNDYLVKGVSLPPLVYNGLQLTEVGDYKVQNLI